MNKYSHEALDSIEGLFTFCEHILDEPLEDQDLIAIQDKLTCLQRQCDAYQEQLRDQKAHSKSDQSKSMAATFLKEDTLFQDFMKKAFSEKKNSDADEIEASMNIGALYVEYLTGRARQSVREALIGAFSLKLIQKEV